MAYNKTVWANDSAPYLNATNLNKMEDGIEAANQLVPAETGDVGQVLTKTSSGTEWSDAGNPTDEQVAGAVSDWLEDNVEPTSPVVDNTLTIAGAAADAKKTGDELSDLKSAIEQGSSLTSAIKSALLQIAQKVAYIDDDGQTYYDDLYDALYPPIVVTAITLNTNSLSFGTLSATQQLTATTTPSGGAVTWSSSDTSVATVSQTGVVTSVGYGNATITATSGSVSATCSVVIAQATVTSISAVYTQSGTVYDTDSLDSLKSDLVVTATYDNATTETVPSTDYTLSGTLTEGTSTITVNYGGKTAMFNVIVTEYVYTPLWTFRNGVAIIKNGTVLTTRTNQTARAAGDAPILNDGYVFTVTDSSKYSLAAYDATSDTETATNTWPAGNKTITWKDTDSVTTAYVWLCLKKNDGTAFTEAELADGAVAVFTYTTNG